MEVRQILEEKEKYLELLLEEDPRKETMQQSVEAGDLFALYDRGQVQSVGVVFVRKNRKCELYNIVTKMESRRKGYGRALLNYICERYADRCDTMYATAGTTAGAMAFYGNCGFLNSHIAVNYFLEHSPVPVYENGKQLTDMIYVKKKLDSEVDVRRVLQLALEAGRILLKNGGEIFRVEETIAHICKRFHVEQVDIFTLSHAIFISADNGSEEVCTKLKHVPLSAAHLGIVAEVNDLSREISAGFVGMEEAFQRLQEIDAIPPKKGYFQILSAGLGSASFGIILGGNAWESIAVFCIGCLLYVFVFATKKYRISKIIVNIMGGVIISTLATGVYSLWPGILHLDKMIIGSIMPLIPGMAFVNAIRDISGSDFLSGTVRMIDALLVFVYIAVGVGFTLGIYKNMIGGLVI